MEKKWLSPEEISEIEGILGYEFRDKGLLCRCFTLSSASGECNNERLEFLGDAVIEFCVSDALYRTEECGEGDLTELRKKFVSNDALRSVTEQMGLRKYMLYEGRRENLGKKPVASLLEAIVAGIYLDGGIGAAMDFVSERLLEGRKRLLQGAKEAAAVNYKGILQEFLQGRGMPRAEYVTVSKSGPDHCPSFLVCAKAQGAEAYGSGGSKAEAEQAAARSLYGLLGGRV